jgi:hypothetical protein
VSFNFRPAKSALLLFLVFKNKNKNKNISLKIILPKNHSNMSFLTSNKHTLETTIFDDPIEVLRSIIRNPQGALPLRYIVFKEDKEASVFGDRRTIL